MRIAVNDFGIVEDRPNIIEEKLNEACRKCDIVVVLSSCFTDTGTNEMFYSPLKHLVDEIGRVNCGHLDVSQGEGTILTTVVPKVGQPMCPGGERAKRASLVKNRRV